MLRVCFPWSQENLSPWYTLWYKFPHPQPTRSRSCNKSSSQSMVMESALCRPYQATDMPSSHHSIVLLIPGCSPYHGFGLWLSLLKKKITLLWDSCVLEQPSKQSAKQWTLSVVPQCVQWVVFPLFPYERCLLAVRSGDSAGESGKIWRWNQLVLVSCFPYLSCESLFVIGLRTTGRTY